MNKDKMQKRQRALICLFVLAILLVNVYRLYIEFTWDNIGFDDHDWIWRECRVAFWGYSPYEVFANQQIINGIGMSSHISSLPWGLVLGTIMHGAFLPYEFSCIWYVVVRSIVVITTAVLVWQYLKRKQMPSWICGLAITSIPATWYAIDCISKANNGEIVCLLIICSICVIDEHPIMAGICMTFSMFKPQTALPFFVLFLFLKKYKTIAVSVIGVLGTWGLSALWTHSNPVAQLQGVIRFANTMEESYHVVGIMDPIRKLGVGSSIAMLCSMAVGMLLMCMGLWILHRRYNLQKLTRKHTFVVYTLPAVVSVMWCYKSAQDYLILLIVAFGVYELWSDKQDWMQALLAVILLGMCMTKPFSTALLGRLPVLTVYSCYLLDLVMKTTIMLLIIIYLIRSEKWFD